MATTRGRKTTRKKKDEVVEEVPKEAVVKEVKEEKVKQTKVEPDPEPVKEELSSQPIAEETKEDPKVEKSSLKEDLKEDLLEAQSEKSTGLQVGSLVHLPNGKLGKISGITSKGLFEVQNLSNSRSYRYSGNQLSLSK